jgi:hypothetical protein
MAPAAKKGLRASFIHEKKLMDEIHHDDNKSVGRIFSSGKLLTWLLLLGWQLPMIQVKSGQPGSIQLLISMGIQRIKAKPAN